LDVGLISNKKSQIPIRACQTGHASVGLFSLSKTKKEKELAGKGWVYGHLIKWVL